MAVLVDTHAIIKELMASGVPEKQAEVLVSKFVSQDAYANELATIGKDRFDLATKNDLKATISELRSEVSEVRAEIAGVKYDLLKWIIPLLFAILGLIITSMFK